MSLYLKLSQTQLNTIIIIYFIYIPSNFQVMHNKAGWKKANQKKFMLGCNVNVGACHLCEVT